MVLSSVGATVQCTMYCTYVITHQHLVLQTWIRINMITTLLNTFEYDSLA